MLAEAPEFQFAVGIILMGICALFIPRKKEASPKTPSAFLIQRANNGETVIRHRDTGLWVRLIVADRITLFVKGRPARTWPKKNVNDDHIQAAKTAVLDLIEQEKEKNETPVIIEGIKRTPTGKPYTPLRKGAYMEIKGGKKR